MITTITWYSAGPMAYINVYYFHKNLRAEWWAIISNANIINDYLSIEEQN